MAVANPLAHAMQSSEALFALDYPVATPRLAELDPRTGALIRDVPLVNWQGGVEASLAFDGRRVLIRGSTNWFGDRLIQTHPADGETVHLQSMGAPWSLVAADFNPSTGVLHGVCHDLWGGGTYCCFFDAATGGATIGAPITSITGITAIAIDSTGSTYACQAGGGSRLYILDMQTGSTTFLGSLSVPGTLAQDLAFNASGQLWASLDDVATGTNTGLYTVDPITYVATLVVATGKVYGIAFGPKTTTTTFCTAKTSSLGCAPSLSGDGFASPTARLGFRIVAGDLNNNRVGILVYSANGRAAIPFQGGLLCVQPPLHRSPAGPTGGSPLPTLDCSGSWSIDYNEMIWNKYQQPSSANDPVLAPLQTPGTTVQCQWWGRDPGFAAPNNSMLSNGLEFVLSP